MKISAKSMALLGLLLSASGVATAAVDDPWMVRVRAVELNWANGQTNGVATNNVQAQNATIPEVDVSYFFTKNIATELVLTYPQNVNINVGGVQKGTIQALPPSLLVQYHFTDLGQWKPYVGAGVNYTIFSNRNNILGGAASVDQSSTGLVAQVGFDYMFDQHWGFNADVKYVQIKTNVYVGATNIGTLNLNPLTPAIGVAYRF
ncbi:MAG: outer membrane beta-barrel protein [Gallionella sp.]|nr:outer membrane beta-barrel protein [Gallionella sp.]